MHQCPEPLHAGLVRVVSGMGLIKGRDDAKQGGILGLEWRGQRSRGAMADGGNDLPLVEQIHIAAQRRGAPGITRHSEPCMLQRFGTHAHLDARRQCRLAAVYAGDAGTGQHLPPMVVDQNHGLGHHQIQRRTPLAHVDLHGFAAIGRGVLEGFVTQQAEVEIGPGKCFGLAAHHFALRLQMLRQLPQKGQRRPVTVQFGDGLFGRVHRLRQPIRCDDGFQRIEAQIVGDGHPLDAALRAGEGQRLCVERGIKRQRRARLARAQRVVLHHLIGQHGDFVARHVNRAQALACHGINGVARLHRQPRRGNVDAQRDHAAAQAAH